MNRIGVFVFSLIGIPSLILAIPKVKTQDAKKPTVKVSLFTMAEILTNSTPEDWRPLDPESTLYLELPNGRVVIALSPKLAPRHVENVKAFAREKYWDGLAIVRAQDNYVVQWADPNSEKPNLVRKIKTAKTTLAAEFEQDFKNLKNFVKLPDGDIYAPEVGFIDGFPVGHDPKKKTAWLIHCYGAVGAGRDNSIDSGGGSELYAVIGHSPRHLDRTITVLGRVVQGMELLSTLPRGKPPMGFYDKPESNVAIKSARLASDVPESERSDLEIIKTESKAFHDLIQSRRHRPEEWFSYRADKIEICNVPIPVRTRVKK